MKRCATGSKLLPFALLLTTAFACTVTEEVYKCPPGSTCIPNTTKLDASAGGGTAGDAPLARADGAVADAAAAVDASGADAAAVAGDAMVSADRAPLPVDGPSTDVYQRPNYDAVPNNGMKATGTYVYVGGYTPSGVTHDDIFAFQMNETTGALDLKGRTPGLGAGPSFAITYEKKFVYVAVESGSRLAALKIEEHGGLSLINWVSSLGTIGGMYPPERATRVNSMGMTVPAAGGNPVMVRVHRSGKWVVTANYYGDVAVYPRKADGSVEAPTVYYTGRNTHFANIHPTKDIVYVSNTHHSAVLTNSISIFNLNPDTGVLTPHPTQARFNERPFLLVRHTAFHPSGEYLYGIGEASDTVAVFKVAADGSLSPAKEYFALPMGEEDPLNRITGAEIVYSKGVVYASLRGSVRDGTKTRLVSFKVDAMDPSKLTLIEHVETRGDHARGFAIDETGAFLIVANQWTSDVVAERNLAGNVSTFSIAADGKLKWLYTTPPTLNDMAPTTIAIQRF